MCLIIREKCKARAIIFARSGELFPNDKLIHLIKMAIAYFKGDNFLMRLLISNDELFPALLGIKYHCIVADEIISIIADIINEGKRQGMFRETDEKAVAYAGLKLVQAFSYIRTMEFYKEKEERYYIDVFVNFFVNAITRRKY